MGTRPIAAIVLLSLLNTSCATRMVPVTDTGDSPVRISVSVGDTVRVLTKHGERPTFQITEITQEALFGEGQRIPYDDMAFVEKRTRKRTASEDVATGAVLVIASGLVVLAVLGGASLGDFAAPPK